MRCSFQYLRAICKLYATRDEMYNYVKKSKSSSSFRDPKKHRFLFSLKCNIYRDHGFKHCRQEYFFVIKNILCALQPWVCETAYMRHNSAH